MVLSPSSYALRPISSSTLLPNLRAAVLLIASMVIWSSTSSTDSVVASISARSRSSLSRTFCSASLRSVVSLNMAAKYAFPASVSGNVLMSA